MQRRKAIPLILLFPSPSTPAPSDIDKLNAFAIEYNDYIVKLQQSILDVKQWKRVEESWKRIR